jgi:hypothetical protein
MKRLSVFSRLMWEPVPYRPYLFFIPSQVIKAKAAETRVNTAKSFFSFKPDF